MAKSATTVSVNLPLSVLQDRLANDSNLQQLVAEHVMADIAGKPAKRGPKAGTTRGPRKRHADGMTNLQTVLAVLLSEGFDGSTAPEVAEGCKSIDHEVAGVNTILDHGIKRGFIKSAGKGRERRYSVKSRKDAQAEVDRANKEEEAEETSEE